MGRHAKPKPDPELPDDVDPADALLLEPYLRRRQPPLRGRRTHQPVGGGAMHVRSTEQRILLRWNDFEYEVVGIADNLTEAQQWAAGANG
ncbi:DUF6087 family protein [Streptacidiphilus neutrinimicus]|uniref:DUF6087 family protein n=1 Tax=Streptacidiphilus neutrinimicus TaxID=105420 RepID=UPI0005A77066|nr:DUF6087 family protein [Streptacidiphilus neutrinimicus]